MPDIPLDATFLSMRNSSFTGTPGRLALEELRRRLPPGWSAEPRKRKVGASLCLSGPDGRRVELPVVVRKALEPRDVLALLAHTACPMLVLSSFLGERTRTMLAQGGASYADATGNVRVVVSRPAIFLESNGAKRNPVRVPRQLHSLRGAAAGRVVRALIELPLPQGVRELATAAAASLGTVSRVVTFLETEALLTRDKKKRVVTVGWEALLARWSQDYELTQSNELRTFLEPRGLVALWPKLERLPRYAATGSTAGPGIAATRIAMLYVDDPDEAAETLGLVPADAGANVWLLRPYDEVVFTRTRQRALTAGEDTVDTITVSAAQAVVDLMSSPGRGPQEATALVESMKESRHAS